jgi:GNAT superfamily N-acetyltransferase
VVVLISELDSESLEVHLEGLSELLHDCVHAGASVGFILPFTQGDSRGFWAHKVAPALSSDRRILWIAAVDKKIVGTVQLDFDLFPNQAHRAEVAKLLVHPDSRRQGIAKQLMSVLEAKAKALGKSLLTLDTRTGDVAEPLYHSLSYKTAGSIPDYCRAPDTEQLDATTYMYKVI